MTPAHRFAILAALFALWLCAALSGVATGARGQEMAQQFRFQHPPATTADPYADWKRHDGSGCCHRMHCAPTYASPDGRSLMRPDGAWWRIDPSESRQNVNRDQHYHVCVMGGQVVCHGLPDLGS